MKLGKTFYTLIPTSVIKTERLEAYKKLRALNHGRDCRFALEADAERAAVDFSRQTGFSLAVAESADLYL